MTMTSPGGQHADANGRWFWIALLTVANIVLSGKFACATPFAALAALAALDMSKRDGLILVGAMWLSNQIVGFAILGYPHEMQAYAWGVAMGLATLAAFGAVHAIKPSLTSLGTVTTVAGSFLVAFAVYQAGVFAATFVLSDGHDAFAFGVVRYVAETNAVAFVALLIVHQIAVGMGLVRESEATLFRTAR